ncbi:MAG: PEP/pyruvate-binding domain-containing protein [Phycisphaerae bacterium]|nr:PEP/pyruvate-binding domain-containing protein [Phycisphaerae bacterium]
MANLSASNSGFSHIRYFGLDLADSSLPDLNDVGGKGINLFKMTAARFPVPPGFVVTTEGYRRFTTGEGLQDRIRKLADSIDPDDVDGTSKIATRIRAMFAETPMPEALAEGIKACYRRLKETGGDRVAVRSSATAEDLPDASFAGQQDTYLNIRGEDAVIKAVKNCWGSLWTDRAVAYRAKKKTSLDGLAMAVVVQQMVIADAAGIMFTANPVTGDDNEIVINAAWGLGEAIVGGLVTPDTIVVDKATGQVKEIAVSDKTVMTTMTDHGTEEIELTGDRVKARVLDDRAVAELAEIGKRIEGHYGHPQDIEWGVANGRFAMLQARPIQGLEVARDVEAGRLAEIERLRAISAGEQRAWVTHNLDETLKNPTPMTWDIISWFMSGKGGYGQMYRDFGYQPSAEFDEKGYLDLVCGRIYADPKRAAGQFWDGVPMEYALEEVLDDMTTLERPPAKFNSKRADGRFFLRLPTWIWAVLRSSRIQKKARKAALEKFEQEIVPEFLDFVAKARGQTLTGLPTGDIVNELERRVHYVMGQFAAESLKPGFFGGLAQGAMLTVFAQLMGDADGEDLGRELTTGLANDTTVEQSICLYRVAQGKATMDEFIERYGHRAAGEMELAQPRWREDRRYLENTLESLRGPNVKSPETRHHEQATACRQAEENLMATLAEYGGSSLYEAIIVDLKDAQKMLPYREVGKHYLMMGYETIRMALLELARRWGLDRDIFFLHLDELRKFEAEAERLKAEIAKRKVRWESAKKLSLPAVIDSAKLDTLGKPEPLDPSMASKEMAARPIASCTATGIARIVFDPQAAGDLGPDYILVCPSTDPGWTPLFVNARGVIVERGGMLSHGAIVARDFGIPAVVLKNATRIIPDGAEIRIDGNRGRVELVGAARPVAQEA